MGTGSWKQPQRGSPAISTFGTLRAPVVSFRGKQDTLTPSHWQQGTVPDCIPKPTDHGTLHHLTLLRSPVPILRALRLSQAVNTGTQGSARGAVPLSIIRCLVRIMSSRSTSNTPTPGVITTDICPVRSKLRLM